MLIQSKDLPVSPKAKVGNTTFNKDPTQEYTSRRPYVDSIPATTVHISIKVTLNPVWDSLVCHCEEAPVCEERLSIINGHIKGITSGGSISASPGPTKNGRITENLSYLHRRHSVIIDTPITVNPICIGNVYDLLIWRKTDTIRSPESIGYSSNIPSIRAPSVDLVRQRRWWPIALLEAINGIGEPDRTIRVHHHVIYRIKWSTKALSLHELSLVGRSYRHTVQSAWFGHGTLSAEENVILAVVDASIAHGDIGRNFLVGHWLFVQVDPSNVNCLLFV